MTKREGTRTGAQLAAAAERGERRPWTTMAAVAVIPALLAVLAIINPGVKVSQIDLNDGSVWLTNMTDLKLGRFNAQINELNAGLVTTDPSFDVVQDASDVLLVEPARLSIVDPAGVALLAQTSVPVGADISMRGGVVAITAPDGRVWVTTPREVGAFEADATPETWELGEGALATVTAQGSVIAVDPKTALVHRADFVEGELRFEELGELTGASGASLGQLAAVGDEVAVLAGSSLHGLGWELDLSAFGGEFVLQDTGPESDVVLVAGVSDLLRIPVSGRDVGNADRIDPINTGASGRPSRPVRVGACEYGAWASSSGNYVQRCDDQSPRVADLEGITSGDELVFRVNRSVVVLNDVAGGRIWLPDEVPQVQEPNWNDIESQDNPDDSEDISEEVETTQNLLAQCSEISSAPSAQDDKLGVRAGRTSILTVLDNDISAECGIITVSEFEQIPESFGEVESVYGGRALQVRVAPSAQGAVSFTYAISDGGKVNAPSTATVTLTVVPDGTNSPPVQVRRTGAEVELGATARINVLADFEDPDGDDLQLVSGTTSGEGTIRARPDGIMTFIADGEKLGRQVVEVQVSDGEEIVKGTVNVDVRPAGSLVPQIDPVHAVAHVDQTIEVDVLAHVRSASREPVRLAGVDAVDGTEVTMNSDAGTFEFTAGRTGPYYIPFVVATSSQQASGLARIDVLDWPEEPQPPIAVRDTALLPTGGQVTIDPLANDSDPNGGVLVLVSAQTAADSALRVSVIDHRLLRISSKRALETPELVEYVVSNGSFEVRGEVLVQPVPPSAGQRPPVVQDIEVSVRTGGVLTVPVMDYAYDPDGDEMTLEPELDEDVASGLLFVSGELLRYQAPQEPTTAHAVFSVTDEAGNSSSAKLTISVHASDAERKDPARPKDLVARVFDGETVRITVPLLGIDDDGDGVSLLGQVSAPEKGRIVSVGADYLEYEAFPGEFGTDIFTYAVEDWVGQRSVATIQVGIAKRPTEPLPIVTHDDEVSVQPGERVEVRVLVNDDNPSGGDLELSEELEVPEGVAATVEGRRIVVDTFEEGTFQIVYRVSNDRGSRASAVLTVRVEEGAVILPPIAEDVVVPALETLDKTAVEVDVLAVAENPSGPLSDLAVSVPASQAGIAQVTTTSKVLVTLGPTSRTVPYLLTNTNSAADGVRTYAFITVPALGDFPPVLRPKVRELKVASGAEIVFDLDEFVQVAPGRSPRITDEAQVSATRSDGSSLVVDDNTLRFVSAKDYAGPASITFEVTDGSSADGAAGRRKTLSLPITVYATEAFPPRFQPTLIEAPQGEAPVGVDLRRMTIGPEGETADPDQYTYALTSAAPAGFTVTLDGPYLSVAADATTLRGSLGSVGVAVHYGGSRPVEGRIEFRASASTRQVPRVNDVTVEGVSGERSTVEVLRNAFNPYPDSPLTITGVTVETPGAGTASASGSSVAIVPVEGFIGEMTVRFRVRDVTNEPSREAEGRVRVKVRSVPDAPGAPRISEVRDRTVVLAWDAPPNNASPISEYEVVQSPGNRTTVCRSTTCSIDGLTNDTEYTFQVRARNEVGWSPLSGSSATARPDQVPDRPQAPDLQFGDRELRASWSTPNSPGSAVSSYTLQISPAPVSGPASVTTSSTSHTFTGLRNGTEYRVQIKAHNSAEGDSGWSPWSTRETPVGVPAAPAAVRAAGDDDRKINVSWDRTPDQNGAPVTYTLTASGGGDRKSWPGLSPDEQSRTFTADSSFAIKNGVEYTFSVTATNKAGESARVTTTATTWTSPGSPTSLQWRQPSEAIKYGAGEIFFSWTAPSNDGGARITGYEIDVNGSTHTVRAGRTEFTERGLAGGSNVTARVRAINAKDMPSEWAVFDGAVPVTVPRSPEVSGIDTSALEWLGFSVNAREAGGAEVTEWEYEVRRGGSTLAQDEGRGASHSVSDISIEGGGEVTIRTRVHNTRGWSEWQERSATVRSPSAPNAPDVVFTSDDPEVARITVTLPENTGGRPITEYHFRVYRKQQGSSGGSWQKVEDPANTTNHMVDASGGGLWVVDVYVSNRIGDSDVVTDEVFVAPPEEDPADDNEQNPADDD